MTRFIALVGFLFFVAPFGALAPAYATVLLNDGGTTTLETVVRDRDVAFPENTIMTLTPTTLPFVGEHTATIGNSTNQVSYDFSQNSFEITNMGARDGSIDSRSNTQGVIFFSVNVDTSYNLGGQFSAVDPSAKGVGLDVTLTDVTASAVLFRNEQSSFGVGNEAFSLGETGGNQTNMLAGNLTGTLLAGHQFRLNYGNSLYASNAGSSASGTGFLSIALAVPILGDFDGDGDLDVADYLNLSTHLLTNVTALTTQQSYLVGDMTADLRIDGNDFVRFRTAYDEANGVGAFVTMLTAIPEPSAYLLCYLGGGLIYLRRCCVRLFRKMSIASVRVFAP